MPSLQDGTRPPLDLSRYTEGTRRALYDAVVEEQFGSVPTDDADSYTGPSYTPDAAALTVFYAYGRWFAAWTDLDEPDLPDNRRIQVLHITAAEDSPRGLLFEEV